MATVVEHFTATLSQPRAREITTQRPQRVILGIESAEAARDVEVLGPRITFGSHQRNTVFIEDEAVSRVHCEIHLTDATIVLRDLGSKNGTWVGGSLKIHEIDLSPGSSFSMGSTTIMLRRVETVDVAISTHGRFGHLHGCSSQMSALFAAFERLSPLPIDVLLTGRTGTGKELAARSIHEASGRVGPFVIVDCAGANHEVLEGELFGTRDTDASDAGLLSSSRGGTLFLDEVGELPLDVQSKLLRALDKHEVRPSGQIDYENLDLRVISSTRHDLLDLIGRGEFRDDLYFRLAEVRFDMPSLGERGSADISMLADVLLSDNDLGRDRSPSLDKSAHSVLVEYSWPGNVRQLRNVVRQAALSAKGGTVGAGDLPRLDALSGTRPSSTTIEGVRLEDVELVLRSPWEEARRGFERIYVSRILELSKGNQSEAARRAGMSRSSFRELAKRVWAGGDQAC